MADPGAPASDPPVPARSTVGSGDLPLAVWQTPRVGPTVVLVHGFPDTHAVWDPVVRRLQDRFHCVTYDVRGAGESGVPRRQDAYAVRHLVADLAAVMDTVSPDQPVHLVGHDWGSIQAWEAVIRERSDVRFRGRIASYSTISGPCLDHVAAFSRSALHGGWNRKREGLHQLLHSWYVYAFHLPLLPEYVLRHASLLVRDEGRHRHFGPTLTDDAVNGLNLYRANIFARRERVPGGATTDVPVQLVVPLRDRYVLPQLTQDLHRFASDLTRLEVDAGHWVLLSSPDELASALAAFVDAHDVRR
ncbi:MAG: alpha/beta fold hydrolase [Nocardioidaceae bacterium]|nr:alpha/beta fold hydrolase [Nocardioidaceae bacterium]